MSRIVILLCSQGHGSGAERVLEYFLAGACDRREEICLVSPESSSVTAVARDLGYSWTPWKATNDALANNLRALFHLIRTEGRSPMGSLVHAWHTRHLEWALALGRLWRVPSSGTLHDDPDPAHHLVGNVRRKIIRAAAARLDGVAAVSKALARRCSDLGWSHPVAVLRNGLPDSPKSPRPKSEAPLRLGFMASGLLWKGTGLLPELVRRTEDLSLQWNLFGTPSTETIPALTAIKNRPNVQCHGQVTLDEALAHIDVLLHLSLTFDPFPHVLLEAARAGLPAIATATGGSPEIVENAVTGLLISPNDVTAAEQAIRRLYEQPETRATMGEAARARFLSQFRVERMVADYFSFWNRLRSASS